jgi:hypothetical protein
MRAGLSRHKSPAAVAQASTAALRGACAGRDAGRLWGRSTEAGFIVTPSLPTGAAGPDALLARPTD